MSVRTLVIEQYAMTTLSNAIVEEKWFDEFLLPDAFGSLRRVQVGDSVYILSERADESSRLLIVRVGADGIFRSTTSKRHVFNRVLHVALMQFERTVSLPVSWKGYRDGSLLSIYALTAAMGDGARLYFDLNPKQQPHVYAYEIVKGVIEIRDVLTHIKQYDEAIENYIDALLTASTPSPQAGAFGIILSSPLGTMLLGSATLEDWYNSKLTAEQRAFVDADHLGPVRLKGSAGTGKTVSMAVKCLRDLYNLEFDGTDARVAFVTHSSALAHDVIPSMFYSLDPEGKWAELKTTALWLGSIYELAEELLQYRRKDLHPLSVDGREGREFQQLLIDDSIEQCLKNSAFVHDFLAKCDVNFRQLIVDSARRPTLLSELTSEFASAIDADFVRLGSQSADRYLSQSREAWQMNLPTATERAVVLRIHEEYCRQLENSSALSMDQMIADFSRYLDSHEWRQLRDRLGYDLIFVDELHYFNRAERMLFHSLFKSRAVGMDRKAPLFMAYDLKQSTTDVFMGNSKEAAGNIFKSVGAGETELVELKTVFRSTPQIAAFLTDLDASFPALDLEGEWGNYAPDVRSERGDEPTLRTYSTGEKLVDDVYSRAGRDARVSGGRHVAVLCLNEQLFDKYCKAGRIADQHVAITARDQVSELKYVRNRVIFSMPEYVAGLQFESVYLIHLDKAEESTDEYGVGARRRFISRCYLGASRATRKLHVACAADRGGAADILNGPIGRKSIVEA